MQRAYPDLSTGRFVSLADLESPAQVKLFRVIDDAGNQIDDDQPGLSILRSRNETGAGSLKARIAAPGHALSLDGARSDELALLRDWRPYPLLLMSLYGPEGGARFELSVRSGEDVPLRWSRTIHIDRGWSLLRIDVDSIASRIDLADVRAIEWRAIDATPVEFYVDDVILANNTQTVLGTPPGAIEAAEPTQPQAGDLYVFNRGRRLVVGVHGRFELAFLDGLLVGWHCNDSPNLADASGLGPWPVPLPADWQGQPGQSVPYDAPEVWSAWGTAVAAVTDLVEATPFRVVVDGRWQFAVGEDDNPRPEHRWRYTIYPTGAIYVSVESTPPDNGWPDDHIGFAIGADGRRGFSHVLPAQGRLSRDRAYLLLTRRGPVAADLLWAWAAPIPSPAVQVQESRDTRRLAAIVGTMPAEGSMTTAHLLRIWPTDIDAAPEAAAIAADYAQPARLDVAAGELLPDWPGDADGDGFNEQEGCYELLPSSGILRFTFAPGPGPRFDPTFRVHESADRRCWVYARGRLVRDVGRDAEGRLMFHLPHVVTKRTVVDVHVGASLNAGR